MERWQEPAYVLWKKQYDKEYRARPEVQEKDEQRRKLPRYKAYHLKANKKYKMGKRAEQYRKDPGRYLWSIAKIRAKKYGVEFTIVPEDVIVPEFCPVYGTRLTLLSAKDMTGASIDRVDNTKGYIKGNVCVISRLANLDKRDLDIARLEALLNYMRKNLER